MVKKITMVKHLLAQGRRTTTFNILNIIFTLIFLGENIILISIRVINFKFTFLKTVIKSVFIYLIDHKKVLTIN